MVYLSVSFVLTLLLFNFSSVVQAYRGSPWSGQGESSPSDSFQHRERGTCCSWPLQTPPKFSPEPSANSPTGSTTPSQKWNTLPRREWWNSPPPREWHSPPPREWNNPPPGGFNSPPKGGFNNQQQGGFNTPPKGGFNTQPPRGFNTPLPGGFNTPPPGGFNTPPPRGFNTPPPRRVNTQPPKDSNTPLPEELNRNSIPTAECQDRDKIYKVGDKWTPTGGCGRLSCTAAGKTTVLGCPTPEATGNCTVGAPDARQPWPFCCPRLDCP